MRNFEYGNLIIENIEPCKYMLTDRFIIIQKH